jgi:hypothetical protein
MILVQDGVSTSMYRRFQALKICLQTSTSQISSMQMTFFSLPQKEKPYRLTNPLLYSNSLGLKVDSIRFKFMTLKSRSEEQPFNYSSFAFAPPSE